MENIDNGSAFYDASLITGITNYQEETCVRIINPIIYVGDCISIIKRGAYFRIATINESYMFKKFKKDDVIIRINNESIINTTYEHCVKLLNNEIIVIDGCSYESIGRNPNMQTVMPL